MMSGLQVITPGYTVITDLGRTRGPEFGMATNGALDQYSARAANALTGNKPMAPLLELTAFDFCAEANINTLIAVTGADARVSVDGEPVAQWQPVPLLAGQQLSIAGIGNGLRVYVSFFGGLAAPRLLGSCAPDTVLGFGSVLEAGQQVELMRRLPPVIVPSLDMPLFALPDLRESHARPLVIDVTDGPDKADFGDTTDLLFAAPFTVGPASNHVGLRFDGTPPRRQTTGEILSRGVPIGAVEVPAGTEVLILHRGRGVTAGYPVLGVVTGTGLDLLAQARPGDTVHFRHATVASATRQTRARQRALGATAQRAINSYQALELYDRATGDPRWSNAN